MIQNQDSRRTTLCTVVCILASFFLLATPALTVSAATIGSPYILVGGQNGTWFTSSQAPRLLQMSMSSGHLVNNLTSELATPTDGTIWTGASNGSQWLVSGFCCASGNLHSPQIYLFDQTLNKIPFNATLIDRKIPSWWGGDIFTASFGGKGNWLVAGLGSGCLPSFQPGCSSNANDSTGCPSVCNNHMSLGLFNGSNFIDLSGAKGFVGHQANYILYASAWNGHYWLVGGGYQSSEILFRYSPNSDTFSFLTPGIQSATKAQGAITSIAWNGKTWLIGGMGFLASYDGKNFTSLTSQLNSALSSGNQLVYPNSVNKIIWTAKTSMWVMGGGLPISLTGSGQHAWVASYKAGNSPAFRNVAAIPKAELSTSESSVLTLFYSGSTLVIGGYDTPSTNRGVLLFFNNATSTITNMTKAIGNMGYVDWVG